jgi:hypothetical protein
MQMLRHTPARTHAWLEDLFSAKAVDKGGIVRRAIRDVDREVGRAALEAYVRRRGFHLVECGGQYIVICNTGLLQVIC